jgi:hypothetical protein
MPDSIHESLHADERCNTCPYHDTQLWRVETNEKALIALNACFREVKKNMGEIEKSQALMQQKFDNIRYPIWIIFAAVLVEIAKALVTFGPSIRQVTG